MSDIPAGRRVQDQSARRASAALRIIVLSISTARNCAPASAESRVRFHVPDEAEELLRGRYRIINVWRPLNGPVMAHPLAVADSATVRDEDLIGVEHRYPNRTGETAAVQYNPGQKWYYWSGMKNEDRLLLKCFDSDETVGQWGRVPHTAFVDPRTPEGAIGRESIEVRALVFG